MQVTSVFVHLFMDSLGDWATEPSLHICMLKIGHKKIANLRGWKGGGSFNHKLYEMWQSNYNLSPLDFIRFDQWLGIPSLHLHLVIMFIFCYVWLSICWKIKRSVKIGFSIIVTHSIAFHFYGKLSSEWEPCPIIFANHFAWWTNQKQNDFTLLMCWPTISVVSSIYLYLNQSILLQTDIRRWLAKWAKSVSQSMLLWCYIRFMFHLVMRTENTFNKHDHITRVLFNEFYDIRLLMPILLATTWNSEHIERKWFENC